MDNRPILQWFLFILTLVAAIVPLQAKEMTTERLLKKCDGHFQGLNYERARSLATKVEDQDPSNPAAPMMEAVALRGLGRNDLARASAERSLELDPEVSWLDGAPARLPSDVLRVIADIDFGRSCAFAKSQLERPATLPVDDRWPAEAIDEEMARSVRDGQPPSPSMARLDQLPPRLTPMAVHLHDCYALLHSQALLNGGRPGRLDDLTATLPRALKKVTPVFPERARAARVGGSVVVQVSIDRSGAVTDLVPVWCSKPNHGFEESTVFALKRWEFEPATVDGEPVAIRHLSGTDFELY